MPKVISIIPARSGSKGLPNKNILNFYGQPLINWSIKFASKSQLIQRCIVSTDSPEIAKISEFAGAEVPFIRDNKLATDTSTTTDVILDVIEKCNLLDDDLILLLEPTSPYRVFSDLKKGLKLFEETECEKAVSVTEAVSSSYRFQFMRSSGLTKKLVNLKFNKFPNNIRRQDIKRTFFLDGSFYFSFVGSFKKENGFLGENTGSFRSNYFSNFEIDSYDDLQLLESIFKNFGSPF